MHICYLSFRRLLRDNYWPFPSTDSAYYTLIYVCIMIWRLYTLNAHKYTDFLARSAVLFSRIFFFFYIIILFALLVAASSSMGFLHNFSYSWKKSRKRNKPSLVLHQVYEPFLRKIRQTCEKQEEEEKLKHIWYPRIWEKSVQFSFSIFMILLIKKKKKAYKYIEALGMIIGSRAFLYLIRTRVHHIYKWREKIPFFFVLFSTALYTRV